MTARELINELLNCDMDKDVELFMDKPHEDEYGHTSGYVFDIQEVQRCSNGSYIAFKDWRVTADDE